MEPFWTVFNETSCFFSIDQSHNFEIQITALSCKNIEEQKDGRVEFFWKVHVVLIVLMKVLKRFRLEGTF